MGCGSHSLDFLGFLLECHTFWAHLLRRRSFWNCAMRRIVRRGSHFSRNRNPACFMNVFANFFQSACESHSRTCSHRCSPVILFLFLIVFLICACLRIMHVRWAAAEVWNEEHKARWSSPTSVREMSDQASGCDKLHLTMTVSHRPPIFIFV